MSRPRTLVIHHTADTHSEQATAVEQNHANRGYSKSAYDSHIAYHFLVGKDGTVKQNRAFSERTGHTRNQSINLESIAIVVAGNFQNEKPNEKQLTALKNLITQLDNTFHFEEIIPHKDASPTSCPGKHLEEALDGVWREKDWETWNITRYYTPERGQPFYYRTTYEEDFKVNCSGDCLVTADGYHLKPEDAFKVAACPPEIAFGTQIEIEGIGVVTCHDRGGAIRNKKIDVWAGQGVSALNAMKVKPGGALRVKFLK